tara:strand:- start:211 stop:498 length:288 start_codon:yes stop_codon:yes gene_type:complete
MSDAKKCEAGCNVFYGGEIKHDVNCVFYPESRTEMYDKALAKIKELEDVLSGASGCIFILEGMLKYRMLEPPELPSYVEAKENIDTLLNAKSPAD